MTSLANSNRQIKQQNNSTIPKDFKVRLKIAQQRGINSLTILKEKAEKTMGWMAGPAKTDAARWLVVSELTRETERKLEVQTLTCLIT